MKEDIKKEWVDNLRNGKFIQGKGNLKVNDSYCCLGVLCETVRNRLNLEWNNIGHISFIDDCSMTLPQKVTNYCELDHHNPSVYINGDLVNLAVLNDCLGYTFEQIADIIEEQL